MVNLAFLLRPLGGLSPPFAIRVQSATLSHAQLIQLRRKMILNKKPLRLITDGCLGKLNH